MSSDSRLHPRTPIELKVEYKKLNTFFYDYTRNISKGGTFIKTPRPLEIGTEFVFRMTVPTLAEPLNVKGTVMWVVDDDGVTEENPDPGMGIRFVFSSEHERVLFEKTVEGLMKEHLGERVQAKLMGKA